MMTLNELRELRENYNGSLKRFKASVYRCEWLKRRMLDAEAPQTQLKLSCELLRQEEDAAHKYALLSEYDYQLKQLHMSTFLRDFEEICRYDYIRAKRR